MAFNLENWIAQKTQEQVIFTFKGELSESMLTDLLVIVENKLEGVEASKKIRKKVYNVAIESLQNLFHHSCPVFLNGTQKKDVRYSIMIITYSKNAIKVTTGNFVDEQKSNFLKKHIDKINKLSKDELKILYKDILDNQQFSDKGGGGLGLVDIARKAENKINYNFYSDKKSLSFFDFSIEIKQ
ncbi:hypothetical protein L21SP5_01082 [Salinivirga cyanobacteriivorans]|uniref:Uncharacterized protein n=1 Tax=Salinivirga cyanobacteriivorans TaxID=1307839 RepID=A0A0S2HXF3_9BACT|nr:SiaB family protein kinase [Salinivirga cyanobacteriivorans]ALO14746.1 hypothetical protein L21SP5_01082 [Salinivirga cyanobacteriivorans]